MKQGNIFEVMFPALPNNMPIRLVELFAGYGSQALALKYLGVEFESWKVVEFDKKVVKAYNELHGSDFPAIDIRDVKELECDHNYLNICTYSFPCQDLSKAGQGKGMTKGGNTRSGLLWEVERILLNTQNKPQVLVMENVPDVIGGKNIDDFKLWIEQLEKMGYSNYVECLNAKNYGIPQNRNRAFMVSIMGEYSYTFPSKMKLQYRLKDMLEIEVDDKYYLSEKMIKYISKSGTKTFKVDTKINLEIARPLTTEQSKRAGTTNYIGKYLPSNYDLKNEVSRIGGLFDSEKGKHQAGSIYDIEGHSPAIDTMRGGYRQSLVAIPEATKQGYAIARDGDGVYINRPHQKRGVVQKGMIQTLVANGNDVGVVVNETSGIYLNVSERFDGGPLVGLSRCLKANKHDSGVIEPSLRIRKLTPKECFRLMGVKDSDSNRLTCSNSQKYALAGNSIVTTVLMAIFGKLLQISWKSKVEKLSEELKEQKENGKNQWAIRD